MKSTIKPIKQNTATMVFEAKPEEVAKAETKALNILGKDVTAKGFRKGKAPAHLIKEQLDPIKIREYTINTLLQEELPKAVKKYKLHLIANPQLSKIDTPKDKGWIITLEIPLMPQVTLGDYQTKVKAALKQQAKKLKDHNQKINLVCDTLIKQSKLEVPKALIDAEVQKSLSRLIDQTQALGVTVEQYLKSVSKTLDQIKTEYQTQAEDNLKLEFILLEVAQDKKIVISDKDAQDFINATGDPHTKEHLNHPDQLPYIKTILAKRKAIDLLI